MGGKKHTQGGESKEKSQQVLPGSKRGKLATGKSVRLDGSRGEGGFDVGEGIAG